MKRIAFLTALSIACACAATAQGPVDLTLNYEVGYQWGFIDKTAGQAVLTLRSNGDTVTGTLAGQSIPWGGRIYAVADTLTANIDCVDGVVHQQVLYENGWYRKPLAGTDTDIYDVSPNYYRTIKGQGLLNADASTMEAVTIMTDMIGYFYIARLLDFDAMTPSDNVIIPISGALEPDKRLRIICMGRTQCQGREAWEVVFNYTYGGNFSNYPVTSYIDTATRVPLLVKADLLIGHVDMTLN